MNWKKAREMKQSIFLLDNNSIRKARHGDIDVLKKKKLSLINTVDIEGILEDEINKLGFDAITIEGGYSAWKEYANKRAT